MNDTITVLLTAAIVFPLIGGVVSPWLGRRVVVGSLLTASGLAVAAATLHGLGDAPWPMWGPVEWLTIPDRWAVPGDDEVPPASTFAIRPGLRFDPLAVAGLLSLTFAAAVILVASRARGVRSSMLVALGAVAAAGCIASADVVQWLAAGALLSAFVIAVSESQNDAVASVGTRRILVAHLVADAILLTAVLLLWNVGEAVRMDTMLVPTVDGLHGNGEPTGPFAVDNLELTDQSTLARYRANGSRLHETVRGERIAIFSLLGFALIGGLGGRCGVFPLFGWLYDAGRRSPTSSMLALGIAVPCAALLLVRSLDVLSPADDVRLILAICGGATAVVNGVITLAQDDERVVLGYATGAFVGMAMIGLSAGGGAAAGAALLLLALPPVVAAFGWGLVERANPAGRRVLVTAGFVLVSGVLGQGTVVASSLAGDGPGGGLVTGMLFASIALVSFGLSRSVLRVLRDSTTDDRTIVVGSSSAGTPSPLTEILCHLGVLLAVGLGFGLVPPASAVWNEVSGGVTRSWLEGLGPAALVASVGVSAAWALAGRDGADPGRVGEPLGPLVRLSRQRFYSDVFGQLFLSLPIRAVAQVCRFVDWFVLDAALTGVPRAVLGGLDASGRPLRRSPMPVALLTLLLASVVLVWTLVL